MLRAFARALTLTLSHSCHPGLTLQKKINIFQIFEALCFEGKEVAEKRKREQFRKLVAGIIGVRKQN